MNLCTTTGTSPRVESVTANETKENWEFCEFPILEVDAMEAPIQG